jgi:AraC family transcriptional regulator
MQTILSSRGRGWKGFGAALVAMPGGRVEAGPLDHHLLNLHLGAPIRVACRLDGGPVQHRIQREGDIDLVPAGSGGRWDDEAPCTALLLRLHPDWFGAVAKALGNDPAKAKLTPRQQLRDARLVHVALALRAELAAADPGDAIYAESLATALAAQLLRLPAEPHARADGAGGLTPRQRRRVLDALDAGLTGDCSILALSAAAGLGLTQFKARFRESFGMPVHQLVIRMRVERARRLLQGGALPLAEIAQRAGFAHQSHMARWLRRVLGVTPAALRRAVQ